jgi:hypothetical protein
MSEAGADHVECHSGHTYAQEPRAVVWRGRRFPVAQIERRWRTPEGPAFLVKTEAGSRFELHYGEWDDTWTIRASVNLDPEAPNPAGPDEDGDYGDDCKPGNDKRASA